jgi:hypothetical protein
MNGKPEWEKGATMGIGKGTCAPLFVRRLQYCGLAGALLAVAGILSHVSAEPAKKKTLGLAITAWRTALYETPDGKEECPDGLTLGGDQVWLSLLTPEQRDKVTKHGTVETTQLRDFALERGPHGEDVCWNPGVVKDPPQKTVQGKKSYGLNLDGTDDGHATPKTCGHEKFVTPDGGRGIDNQWYRVIGCTYGWRAAGGYTEEMPNGELRDGGHPILVEITGIDDLRNSKTVDIAFYHSTDGMIKDNAGNILPNSSYRVAKDYLYTTHGSIVDGVLTTVPIDIHFPFYAHFMHSERFIKDARLRLDIAADGKSAAGLVAGYYDLDSFWSYMERIGELFTVAHFDCPALYEAVHRLADGYPDPKTGQCTAISADFAVTAVSGYVIHPDAKTAQAATSADPVR